MYDVTNIVVEALSESNGDESIEEVRRHVVEFFENAEDVQGAAKTYTWEESGELVADPLKDIWIYEFDPEVGDFVSAGPAEDLL